MDDETPVFRYTEKFDIAGRGTVYYGPCPFDDLNVAHPPSTIGRILLVDGEYKEIRGMEMFMRLTGPRLGEGVGILFKAKPSWAEHLHQIEK